MNIIFALPDYSSGVIEVVVTPPSLFFFFTTFVGLRVWKYRRRRRGGDGNVYPGRRGHGIFESPGGPAPRRI